MSAEIFVPDILIVGVQKAGTTSIVDLLVSHNRCFVTNPKEPGFFHTWGNSGTRKLEVGETRYDEEFFAQPANYARLFSAALDDQVTIDASTEYFSSPHARHNLQQIGARPKVVICLRNPAQRAYSAFWFARKVGIEPIDNFAAALAAEDQRMSSGFHSNYAYVGNGRYAAPIQAWRETVGTENVLVLIFEEIIEDSRALSKLLEFVGLEDCGNATLPRTNTSGILSWRGRLLRSIFARQKFGRNKLVALAPNWVRTGPWPRVRSFVLRAADRLVIAQPKMTAEEHNALLARFESDIFAVSALIGRDLTKTWRLRD